MSRPSSRGAAAIRPFDVDIPDDKGGHFAAWEEPELFVTEIRAAFQTLR